LSKQPKKILKFNKNPFNLDIGDHIESETLKMKHYDECLSKYMPSSSSKLNDDRSFLSIENQPLSIKL
jgi:hypothetical protein